MNAVVDNDIIVKSACYGLIDEIFDSNTYPVNCVGTLGSAVFVARRAIRETSLLGSTADALDRVETFLKEAILIEPTENELFLAADLEHFAQRHTIALDTGESLLCAVAVSRGVSSLLTGDKRAIAAIQVLYNEDLRLRGLANKVICFEQLVVTALGTGSAYRLRTAVCAEPFVDRVLSICFGCNVAIRDARTLMECLQQHIKDLRSNARYVLAH